MDRRTLFLLLGFAWLASVAAATNTKTKKEGENDWIIRLCIDLFNFGVIAYDQCGPHSSPGQCKTFMAVFFVLVVVVFVVAFVAVGIMVMLGISPPSSSSSRFQVGDGFRVNMTADSCTKLWKLFGPK